ncbi:hypothetical protein AVEN_238197-1 [Araneus ventricosus]|uniref:HAT C-terminal dimerisation domain-containing protein n=1 Tax=Araneus ventricosus TaxID=182803 RepID=A0A4Y2JU63_ARAVE|nr:hypothetical protein AVEN_238197-1 [Araneus ventricosus]
MSCLDPRVLLINKEANLNKLQSILLYLTNVGRVKEEDCDNILKEYSSFVTDFSCMDTATQFRHCCNDGFEPLVDRLDVFYYEFLSNSKYSKLWNVVQVLLLLSHGQASVERGFSINKNLLVENLGNETIVAKRIIDDHLRFVGGLEKLVISKELIISAAGAHQKYVSYLEKQKICIKNKTGGEKRKLLAESVEDLKKKEETFGR